MNYYTEEHLENKQAKRLTTSEEETISGDLMGDE
tara:strand:+ start:534 stop:635 length:102 start_codon:yes stop_codon:yes gene_type:complete